MSLEVRYCPESLTMCLEISRCTGSLSLLMTLEVGCCIESLSMTLEVGRCTGSLPM